MYNILSELKMFHKSEKKKVSTFILHIFFSSTFTHQIKCQAMTYQLLISNLSWNHLSGIVYTSVTFSYVYNSIALVIYEISLHDHTIYSEINVTGYKCSAAYEHIRLKK